MGLDVVGMHRLKLMNLMKLNLGAINEPFWEKMAYCMNLNTMKELKKIKLHHLEKKYDDLRLLIPQDCQDSLDFSERY